MVAAVAVAVAVVPVPVAPVVAVVAVVAVVDPAAFQGSRGQDGCSWSPIILLPVWAVAAPVDVGVFVSYSHKCCCCCCCGSVAVSWKHYV